jgi:uncharacterized protein (TIGR02001 family)
MKILPVAVLFLVTQSTWAEILDHVTGNINVTSNYTYRGINRHSGNQALYGNLKYMSENGLYAGVWVGNYKPLWSDDSDTETDLYLGFNHDLSFGHNLDLSLWTGTYDQETRRDYDWVEWQMSYLYRDRWRFTFAVADNLYGSDDPAKFAEVSFVHQTNRFTLVMSLGNQRFGSRYLSDVTYLHTRVSLDWRNWHLFLDSNFTDLKSESALFSRNWDTRPNSIGIAYSF